MIPFRKAEETFLSNNQTGMSFGTFFRAHLLFPLWPLGIPNDHSHGSTQGASETNASEDLQLVLLDGHALASAEAAASTHQLGLQAGCTHLEAGRKPLNDRDEARAVGFTGSQETQHGRGDGSPRPVAGYLRIACPTASVKALSP